MTMTPGVRNLALTAHVTTSVGWLGAVAVFLALAVAGLTSRDGQMMRSSYLSMDLTGWLVLVPLSLASLVTGLVQSLGTPWGLFRHYWVVAKVVITLPATILLLLHMEPIGHLAAVVEETRMLQGDLAGLRIQLVANAAAALLVLLVATVLSVYKPGGRTRYGQRKHQEQLAASLPDGTGGAPGRVLTTSRPRWVSVSIIVVVALILLFVMQHLAGGGLRGHAP